jgi:hypothetical protein
MGKRLRIPVALGLGLFAALVAATAFSNPSVSFRSAERDGGRVAEVLIGEQVVIVLRTWAGGYSPVERAEIVANRLRQAMAANMEMYEEDVEVGPVPSGQGVFLAEHLVVAVYPSEAEAHGATAEALATTWRDNIILALGLGASAEEPGQEEGTGAEVEAETVPEVGAAVAEVPAETVDWTGAAQKWVPIFSLSGEGVSAGFAQVAGPTDQVDKVKAVAELRLSFQSVGRIYAYIPVSAISAKPKRVQGVSVWAIADVKLVNF